jgi:hypothetical protein
MSEKRWSCSWGQDVIAVEISGSGLSFERRLLVNGQIIDLERSPPLRQGFYLCARTPLSGVSRIVEAAVGVRGGAGSCKIYVDCQPVGGMPNVVFDIPEPLVWEKVRARGRAAFLARRGLTSAAPFVAGMVVINLVFGRTWLQALLVGLIAGLLFGGTMADSAWQVAERQYQVRQRKLAGSAWVEPPQISPAKRVVSLVLISVAVLLLVLGAIMAALIVGSANTTGAAVLGWLLIPLFVIALGVVLIAVAKGLRKAEERKA